MSGYTQHYIVKVRKDDSEKFRVFYTTSTKKIQRLKDAGFTVVATVKFKAAVLKEMSLKPLPEPSQWEVTSTSSEIKQPGEISKCEKCGGKIVYDKDYRMHKCTSCDWSGYVNEKNLKS
jgi:hypothetical protein